MDGYKRNGSHFPGLQPNFAENLWWCYQPVILADVAKLQPGFAELLALEPSWLFANESSHEPDQPCRSLRRSDEPAILSGFAQVFAY